MDETGRNLNQFGSAVQKVKQESINYRPQKMFAKVMFLHLSVSPSVHSGGGPSWQGRHAWQGGHVWQGACMAGGHAWQGMHAWWGDCAWQILRDTVNELAVRILLECILD